MLKTGFVIDQRYENHTTHATHPECPPRIRVLLDRLDGYDREGLIKFSPRLATTAELLLNHAPDLVEAIALTAGKPSTVFDEDTRASSDTYDTARLATGGLLTLVDAVMQGEIDNGFAAVRPPGHHAEADRAMGFCFFNHVAIAARYLQDEHGLERILIMDFDVHHGNGTQRSFFAESEVMYISTHQYPFYPGTGGLGEIGVAGGAGYNINVPLPAGMDDADYAAIFAQLVDPIATQFDPEFVLISAGFDAHHRDPLGGMRLTENGFATITASLLDVANRHAKNRCVAVLEGGYDLDALADSVVGVLDEMGNVEPIASALSTTSHTNDVIEGVRKGYKRFWKF